MKMAHPSKKLRILLKNMRRDPQSRVAIIYYIGAKSLKCHAPEGWTCWSSHPGSKMTKKVQIEKPVGVAVSRSLFTTIVIYRKFPM